MLLLTLGVLGSGCRRPSSAPAVKDASGPAEKVAIADVQPRNDYVDDAQCAQCHAEISEQYAAHGMGQSLHPVTTSLEMPGVTADEVLSFTADGFRYEVRKRGDRWVHRQVRLSADGDVAPVEFPVAYAVGSGNHGRSYLVQRDDALFMSPITWYPDKQRWDLSPGYETRNSQFHRPVIEACLYCHANRALPVADSLNRYETPAFAGHSIGCQRCHGPGAAHVRVHADSAAEPDTIVNPQKLPPDLREAVCQQCHLSGAARVLKPERQWWDFRPGESLASTMTVFTQPSAEAQFVGHVEQMYQSRCFTASDGQLGCTSCHDPHRRVGSAEVADFYRQRCLQCHTADACHEQLSLREQSADNCIQCHMPQQATEVRHAATSDHTIPRRPGVRPTGDSERLAAFPTTSVAEATLRDRALAVSLAAHRDGASFTLDADERTALADAAEGVPEDVAAMETMIEVLLSEGEVDQAIQMGRKILQTHPRREQALTMLGEIYGQVGNHGQAIAFWRRAIEVNPHMAKYWYQLGLSYSATGQWFLNRQTMAAAKPRFPTSVGVRQLLVEAQWRLGDAAAAKAEFEELRAYDPRGMGALEDWYQRLTAAR